MATRTTGQNLAITLLSQMSPATAAPHCLTVTTSYPMLDCWFVTRLAELNATRMLRQLSRKHHGRLLQLRLCFTLTLAYCPVLRT
ncbi:hypothetical protein HDK64DRAFT_261262 [Phyllosticta capitalensis]